MLMPWAAIFSMAKSSSAERTTSQFQANVAVVHGFGVMSQCCVSVCSGQQYAVLSHIFTRNALFIKGTQR